MKLASLIVSPEIFENPKSQDSQTSPSVRNHRDGFPVMVSQDNRAFQPLNDLASSVREILENWALLINELQKRSESLNLRLKRGEAPITLREGSTSPLSWQILSSLQTNKLYKVEESFFHSPLPRAFQWADGSAFLEHVRLVRRARNAPIPESLTTVPLMYQGGSDTFLAPREDIPAFDPSFGIDFEGEIAVVTDFVPMGTTPQQALKLIRLVVMVNDVTLRGLIPDELAQGFGFFQSKPSSAFGPFAVTPDELGSHWREGRLHLPLCSELNGKFFGNPDAGVMHFHFGDLIAHAARTRDLGPGTIIGSGTVSSEDRSRGSSCIVEQRMIEKIDQGDFKSPYLKPGDTIRFEVRDPGGHSIFGVIHQKVAGGAR